MAQPAITAAQEPTEYRLLEGARSRLQAAFGLDYIYDAAAAYLVARPQIKHLHEMEEDAGWARVLYLVSPGDLSPIDYTQCATLFPGDFLVTAGVKVGGPELPWLPGAIPPAQVQLRIVQDIYKALHLQEVEGATLKIVNRNLDLEVDGWALVQVQIGFEFSEVDP
jgi:hypothetical protein